jgi:predicted nucleotidyltransferase
MESRRGVTDGPERLRGNEMKGQAEIIRIILQHYPDTQAIYLFGSYGTENEWPDSDVDIAILLPHVAANKEKLMAISPCRNGLVEALAREVDLVNVRLTSTVFQFQVVTTGRLIYEGNEKAVQEFEMLTISMYQKLSEERRPILDAFRKTRRAYPV